TQFRDKDGLDHEDRQRDEAKRPALEHDEEQRGPRLPYEESRSRESLADEAAQRIDFVLDHRRDLGTSHAPVLREREAQHAIDKLVAQAAKHALAQTPFVRVYVELEGAVDDDEAEEGHRKGDERAHAI